VLDLRLGIRIERCTTLALEGEIKALFRRNEHSGFANVYDRAYAHAYAAGGTSWIARDAGGAIVGHMAAFPRVFYDGTRPVRAALLVDCLFDRGHRNFFSPLELCRQAVADLRASGDFDFSYTDPTPPSVAILKATGFTALGGLQRMVMPTHPLYVGLARLTTWADRLSLERVTDPYDGRVTAALGRLTGGGFRAARTPELYAARLGGPDLLDCEWLVGRKRRGGIESDVALVLAARQPGGRLLNIVDVLWDDARVSPATVLLAAARAAWAQGYTRLGMVTLVPSGFAGVLKRCGFIRRRDTLPLLVLPLRETALPPHRRWLLTFLDGSGW
jgi:hypothetical protein